MNMKDRRVQKTRTAIREAFASLVMEKEYQHLTVSEIAKRANIDRKTFYLHYENIDGIMGEMEEKAAQSLIMILEVNDFFDNSFDIGILYPALNSLVDENAELFRRMAKNPSYGFFILRVKDIIKDTIIRFAEQKIEMNQEEASLYAEFFASGIVAVYVQWLKGGYGISAESVAKIAGNAAYYGSNLVFKNI